MQLLFNTRNRYSDQLGHELTTKEMALYQADLSDHIFWRRNGAKKGMVQGDGQSFLKVMRWWKLSGKFSTYRALGFWLVVLVVEFQNYYAKLRGSVAIEGSSRGFDLVRKHRFAREI